MVNDLPKMFCASCIEAFSYIPTNKLYMHYKGGIYLLLNDRIFSTSTNKREILYVCLWTPHPSDEGPYFTRPYNEFHEQVDSLNYKGPRFRKITAYQAAKIKLEEITNAEENKNEKRQKNQATNSQTSRTSGNARTRNASNNTTGNTTNNEKRKEKGIKEIKEAKTTQERSTRNSKNNKANRGQIAKETTEKH
jgi:hypothetical protein